MADKTLCRDCMWMDFSRPSNPKNPPVFYYCKRLNKYSDPNKNTACPKWNKD